jgi:hypothetical protein
MPPRPPKPIKQQFAESQAMLAARGAAMQTPQEVREAFLKGRRSIGPVNVDPFSLGILWLFEELKHPFNDPKPLLDAAQKPVLDANQQPLFEPLTMRDTARAIFIFHDPEAAGDALAEGEEVLDSQARALARGIAPSELAAIIATISKTFAEGLATIPGAGNSNPPATA